MQTCQTWFSTRFVTLIKIGISVCVHDDFVCVRVCVLKRRLSPTDGMRNKAAAVC